MVHDCEKECNDLNADIAGISEHIYFDTARDKLEKRMKLPKSKIQSGSDNRIPSENDFSRLYTDLSYNFTSKKWMNSNNDTYEHSSFNFVSTTTSSKGGRILNCKEFLRASLYKYYPD